MNYVKRFLNGKWLLKAATYLASPKKMKWLVEQVRIYCGSKGLEQVRQQIGVLTDFVADVTKGRYKGYNKSKLLLCVAALLYVVSPLDLVPDFVIGLGFLDDVAIVLWAFKTLGDEIEKYRKQKSGDGIDDISNNAIIDAQ